MVRVKSDHGRTQRALSALEAAGIALDWLTATEMAVLAAFLPVGALHPREDAQRASGVAARSFCVHLSRLRPRLAARGLYVAGGGRWALLLSADPDALIPAKPLELRVPRLRQTRAWAWRGCATQDCGACGSCRIRGAWRAGKFARRVIGRPRDAWLPEHEAALRQWCGVLPIEHVVRQLEEQFGVPRTVAAVRTHACKLGLATWTDDWTVNSVSELLGCAELTVAKNLIGRGLLRASRRQTPDLVGHRPHWRITATDLETFLRTCSWAYDWTRMTRGHRLTKLAEVVNRSDPWLTLDAVRRELRIGHTTTLRHVRAGHIPHRRRYVGKASHGHIMVRRADVAALRGVIGPSRGRGWRQGLGALGGAG